MAPTKISRATAWCAGRSRKSMTRSRPLPCPACRLIWSEFNASYKNEPEITDSSTWVRGWPTPSASAMAWWTMMSYWSFSDVFEEQGVVKKPFYGGYGLIAAGGIPKPAFAAFKVLHQLGQERLALDSDSALATRAVGWFVSDRGVEPHSFRSNRRGQVRWFCDSRILAARTMPRFREPTTSTAIRIRLTKKWARRSIPPRRNCRSCGSRWNLARQKSRN